MSLTPGRPAGYQKGVSSEEERHPKARPTFPTTNLDQAPAGSMGDGVGSACPESEEFGDTWGSPKLTNKVGGQVHTSSGSAGRSDVIHQDRSQHSPGAEKRTDHPHNVSPTRCKTQEKISRHGRKKKKTDKRESETHSQKKAVNKN